MAYVKHKKVDQLQYNFAKEPSHLKRDVFVMLINID